MNLKDKVCIITGGGTGIGKACAIRLAQEGCKILICGRREHPLKETVSEIKNIGGESTYFTGDLSVEENVEKMASYIVEKWGIPKILINNAGNHLEAPLEETNEEKWNLILNSNLKTTFLCCKKIMPLMAKAEGGSVVNIASALALRGSPGNSLYSASKGGVISLTRSLAIEYAPFDVRVNAVIPGVIKTEHYKQYRTKKEPGYERKILRHIPLGRLGNPSEVANAVLFLASENSSYITGSEIFVDGGYCSI